MKAVSRSERAGLDEEISFRSPSGQGSKGAAGLEAGQLMHAPTVDALINDPVPT
jgi:hypothetical protein